MNILTDPTAFDNVVTALQNILNTDYMFGNLATLIPVVGGVLLFSFTFYLIRRILKGASKGKARI